MRVRELMDEPDCDPELLARTYQRFTTVNRLVSGWRRIYRTRIRPRLAPDRPATLLDIGFGGGDIPRALAAWAVRDGLQLHITAIDPDERALAFARSRPAPGVRFERASSADIVARGDRFDVVTSNHLLHHLGDDELREVLDDSTAVCDGIAIHNDLSRNRFGYGLYAVAALPIAGDSFVRVDGLRSIRRSYRAPELQRAVPPGWRVSRMFPQRVLATFEAGSP